MRRMTPAGPARAERVGGKGRVWVWVRPQRSEARPRRDPCGGGRVSAFPAPLSEMMKEGDGSAGAPP